MFDSKMDTDVPCKAMFGLPKPVECRLKDGEGGIGAKRECVSDKGTIQQRILEWIPGQTLSFELEETDIYFGPCVQSIVETFQLQPVSPAKTTITRITVFKLKPYANPFLIIPMSLGLKSIHKYVFKNWQRIAFQESSV